MRLAIFSTYFWREQLFELEFKHVLLIYVLGFIVASAALRLANASRSLAYRITCVCSMSRPGRACFRRHDVLLPDLSYGTRMV